MGKKVVEKKASKYRIKVLDPSGGIAYDSILSTKDTADITFHESINHGAIDMMGINKKLTYRRTFIMEITKLE